MTSGDHQDWRGGRTPRNSPRTEKAVPSWKQSRSTAAASVPTGFGRWKRRLRILFVTLFLFGLVASVIYMWWPTNKLTTHFVLLNLREVSADFDVSTGLQLPKKLVGAENDTYKRRITQCSLETLRLSKADDKESQTQLDKAQVVVIYLQTTFVPAPNGQFLCLLRNSTPNLNNANEYVDLQNLKNEITTAAKKGAKKRWLLLVDQISAELEWRTGFLQSDVSSEFESWVKEIPELVVVLSSASSDESEPGNTGTNGRSIFSHFVSLGLSKHAAKDPKGDLNVNEFCSFVSEQTNAWVRTHRNPAGQSVRTFPADSRTNFVIMRDAVELAATDADIPLTGSQDAGLARQIKEQWILRESPAGKGASLWSPLEWRAATEELKHAERALLHGSHAQKSFDQAREPLGRLQNQLAQICPDDGDFQQERGVFRRRFSTLPSATIRNPAMFPAPADGAAVPNTLRLVEDVIASHLKSFENISGVTQDDVDATHKRRQTAEESFAQLFNCSHVLQQTVTRLEQELLLTEDRQFTRKEAKTAEEQQAEEPQIDNMLVAVAQFAEAHDAAETTLRNALECIPDLAFWAAHCNCSDSELDQKAWQEVLTKNGADARLKPEDVLQLRDRLSSNTADVSAELPGLTRGLRLEVFQLCANAKGLRLALEMEEPQSGFNVDELKARTDELRAWDSSVETSATSTRQAAETLCATAVKDEPGQRVEQVRVYQFLRSALNLTCVSARTHNDILDQLQKWNKTWGEKQDENTAAKESTEAPWHPSAKPEALWLLQILNLMPVSKVQSGGLEQIQGMLDNLDSEDPLQKHQALAEFGDVVRTTWIDNQKNVAVAVKSTSADALILLKLLRDADLQARLYSGFDAKTEIQRSPVARLRQLTKLQYCLMQADRLLAGLWLDQGEQEKPPTSRNGWYAKATMEWLEAAQVCSKEPVAGGQTPLPAELDSRKKRLESSDELKFVGNAAIKDPIHLGDESQEDSPVKIAVSETVPESVSGEASVLIRLAAESAESTALMIDVNATPIVVGQGNTEATLNIRRKPTSAVVKGCGPFALKPEVFFRGHSWSSAHDVSVSTCAAQKFVTEILPRPDTASITVSGFDPRPVVLILDFSGSMKLTLADGTPRYEAAISTLKTIIASQRLNESRIVLKVYGHRTKFVRMDGDNGINEENPNYITEFPQNLIPNGLQVNNDIFNEFDERIDTPAKQQKLIEVLKSLERSLPWGATPLIKSLRNALALDLKDGGVVIAITDGEPTDDGKPTPPSTLEPDETGSLTKAIEEAIKKGHANTVRIVAFDLNKNPEERKRLETTFKAFKDSIGIVDASKPKELLDQIEESLDPREFSIWKDTMEIAKAELKSSVSDLPAGNDYTVQFGNDISLDKITLNRGDALKLDVSLKEKRFRIDRPHSDLQQSALQKPSGDDDQPWILKCIGGAQTSDIDIPGEDATKFARAVLYLMLDREGDRSVVRQPAEIEFNVWTDDDSPSRPAGLSRRFDSMHGAPAWELTIDKWEKGKNFVVDAFWKMERSMPQRIIEWETLSAHNSSKSTKPLGENADGLPPCKVWTTFGDRELQVRIDVVPDKPYPDPDPNPPAEIRVELGKPDTLEQAATFRPWEIKTEVIRTERGSVIYKFSGDKINPIDLQGASIAFTSMANRRKDAIIVEDFKIPY